MDNEELLNLCDACEQDFDTLHGKGCFQGNKDDRMMCESCYEEAHGELP